MDVEILKLAFIEACKYLQHNPPLNILDLSEEGDLGACLASNTYEDGWIQWANYFLKKVEKDKS